MENEKPISKIINDIIEDIQNDECILFIGPDIIKFDNFKDSFSAFQHTIEPGLVTHIFEHEGVFDIVKNRVSDVSKLLNAFYRHENYIKDFEGIFEKIADIPFSLIISFIPTSHLTEYLNSRGIKHRFSYFAVNPGDTKIKDLNVYKIESIRDTEPPTPKNPIVYNILGLLNVGEVILTFEHVFNYLQKILPISNRIPEPIYGKITSSKTHIYLGIPYDKWYLQLVLKLFKTSIDEYKRYHPPFDDKYTYIQSRLGLDVIPELGPQAFIDKLHAQCSKKNILKERNNPRVFISYSTSDSYAAKRIISDLEAKNISVIIDTKNASPGELAEEFIKRTLDSTDFTIFLVSMNSLSSYWVCYEIKNSIEKGKNIYPIIIDESVQLPEFYDKLKENINLQLTNIYKKYLKTSPPNGSLKSEKERFEYLNENFEVVREYLKQVIKENLGMVQYEAMLQKLIKKIIDFYK